MALYKMLFIQQISIYDTEGNKNDHFLCSQIW